MAAAGKGSGVGDIRSLQETPTWAVAVVCFVFIAISIVIEQLIHLVSHWLKKHRKTALYEAVEKLKSVLIVMGFMSLILTVTQKSIAKICIPTKVANRMLPCHLTLTQTGKTVKERILAAAGSATKDYCGKKGKTSLISENGLNQLNIFIFVLAFTQILYSVLTMALGRAKMRRWKAWERETQSVEYLAQTDPNRFRMMRQTTFARRHTSSCSNTFILLWIKCFFRQFFNSVAKVDYLTLRHGFITEHLSNNNQFNFQSYIQRSLDDDFKSVVGISPFMWFLVVIFMLVDVHGANVYLWVSFLPLTIVLILGTKLEIVMEEMALELQNQNSVIKGAPLVQPNDGFFWFNHPNFVLTLIHYTLFMNAFELAFFVWVTWQFGINSCYHERNLIIIIRMVLAFSVQVICSYITLPLYALVTQMGSKYKGAVLEQQTASVIKQWHADVKRKRKKQDYSVSAHGLSPTSVSSRPIVASSPDSCSHHRDVNFSDSSSSHNGTPTFTELTSIPTRNHEIVVVEDDVVSVETNTPERPADTS